MWGVLQLSMAGPEISDIVIVYNQCSTLDMGDNEGVMIPNEMNNIDFGGAGGDAVPFVTEIANILSSDSLVMGDSTVSSLLEVTFYRISDLNVF